VAARLRQMLVVATTVAACGEEPVREIVVGGYG
jgi:hypothetical protein